MSAKRRIAAGLLAALMIAALILPASAHGHHGGGNHNGTRTAAQTATVALCTVEDCDTLGQHTHDGVTYCGYEHTSGSCDGSHQLCTVDGCITVGAHTHRSQKCHTSHGCHGR